MKRMVVCAVAALCVAGTAHAQGSGSSKKYDWNDTQHSCMEPYAPAVPKAEDTDLQEMVDEVKPEIEDFIKDSSKYLECLGLRMAKAREDRDQETLKALVKQHNENVEYQKSVAEEFNETLKTLKIQAGLIPPDSETVDGKTSKSAESSDGGEKEETAEKTEAKSAGTSESGTKEADGPRQDD